MTLTPDEYTALAALLQRLPMTHAEALAVRMILAKLAPPAQEPPPHEQPNGLA